jgi:hypothetical protein
LNFNPPHLGAATSRSVVPDIASTTSLDAAASYLDAYSALDAATAVAVQRAANQFADALWWADTDPRSAWIKLFGAVEAAADHWDLGRHEDPVEQLKRRHHRLARELETNHPDALQVVAKWLSRVLGAESKMIDFVLAHAPSPPRQRPSFGELDFTNLQSALHILYDHRSRELHGGIPFPEPLCEAPTVDEHGVAAETFPALGASSRGGTWSAERLPMYLHTFARIVGEALRKWWLTEGNSRVDPDQRS